MGANLQKVEIDIRCFLKHQGFSQHQIEKMLKRFNVLKVKDKYVTYD